MTPYRLRVKAPLQVLCSLLHGWRSRISSHNRVLLLLLTIAIVFGLELTSPEHIWSQSTGPMVPGPPENETPPHDPYDLLNRPDPLWLVGIDWQGENLNGAHLASANLAQAKLQSAQLNQADLSNANLIMASMQASQLVQARLDGADLGIANLARAHLSMASMAAAKLEGATLVESNLTGAKLDKAQMSHSNLRRANLRNASLQEADLTLADLQGADLRGADLTGANLSNANLEEANLQGARLEGAHYDQQTVWPAGFDPAHSEASVALGSPMRQPLSLQINLVPGFVQQYNQLAQPGDIARVDNIEDMAQLEDVHAGERMVVFKSATLAEALLPRTAGYVDMIGYNLEHGPTNPLTEQKDPIGSVQRMRALADHYGVPLAIGPDHDFVLSHGVQIAPYADQFILQVQRVQDQPELVESYVISTADALRQANPALQVVVQVRTDGDLEALVSLLERLKPHIDGVAILTSHETTDFATALWNRLRQEEHPPAVVSPEHESPNPSVRPPLFLLFEGIMIEVIIVTLLVAPLWFWHSRASKSVSVNQSEP